MKRVLVEDERVLALATAIASASASQGDQRVAHSAARSRSCSAVVCLHQTMRRLKLSESPTAR